MHVEPWVSLGSDNPDTCTSDDIAAFTWQVPRSSESVTESTVGALIVEFTRGYTDNAVYRYDDIQRRIYDLLRETARQQDAERFDEVFKLKVRNHSRGRNYTRQRQA